MSTYQRERRVVAVRLTLGQIRAVKAVCGHALATAAVPDAERDRVSAAWRRLDEALTAAERTEQQA